MANGMKKSYIYVLWRIFAQRGRQQWRIVDRRSLLPLIIRVHEKAKDCLTCELGRVRIKNYDEKQGKHVTARRT